MSSSSKIPIIRPIPKQRGGFVVTFDKKSSGEYFVHHFDDTASYFALTGTIYLGAQEAVGVVRGVYTAIGGVDVLKSLQFAVNKTFDPTLTALDPGAFDSGRTNGTVTTTSFPEEDVPKRADVSSAVSKTIIVSAGGLDRDLNILFAFEDPSNDQLFTTQFPTAWRVAYLSKGLNNVFSATYIAQYAVGATQLVNGNIVTPTVWTDAAPGDLWTLTLTNNTYHIDKTKAGDPTNTNTPITVLNNTGGFNPIAVGFDNSGTFNIALTQTSVGQNQTARFLFTPILNAWVVSDYVQNQVLKSEIVGAPLFGAKGLNLLGLTPVTQFKFAQGGDGNYSITQV